ncbi:hypothetical protein FEM48_Zijuj02G0201300 [Ziziphus jujuba var. spinosa]|uniref:Beta-glucosidase 12-like n=1 Tax=Ziziphus jujuba var. spinosa TaxID=714518 RepID=A0A978VXQ8_ZIZJJ|nr:hypothetical protein FEM48_Zijuj02G0201300 [Ziziphus jujuba var. spinosa]
MASHSGQSQGSVVLVVSVLLVVCGSVRSTSSKENTTTPTTYFDVSSLNRSSFPAGFIFGTASASYQYEGAAREDGKGPSIWDYYSHKYPEKIKDGSNGDVANDQYHRYKEDVGIMKEMNLDGYRFSISWSRLLPNGKLSGGVNKKGIEYYNNLINELLAKGLKPFVTIFHWDLPQALEDEYGGFLSPDIVNHYRDFAELCFKEFGDRVKHWITLNEPWTYSNGGYANANLAPFRCSEWQKLNCTGGDSGTEPYLVAHHLILSHAAAVKLYKDKNVKIIQAYQKGLIGITLVSHWMVPYSDSKNDQNAALRALDFMFGWDFTITTASTTWFMDPLTYGDYPRSMRSLVGKRLPEFTKEESKLVKGSFDFLGLNYYTANYARHVFRSNNAGLGSYTTDARANQSSIDEFNDPKLTLEQALVDNQRIDYYRRHLYYLQKAIKSGVNVKGYFAWSLLDNFEWSSGYTVRFGINYVDYKHGLTRYPKSSAHWFKAFLKR